MEIISEYVAGSNGNIEILKSGRGKLKGRTGGELSTAEGQK